MSAEASIPMAGDDFGLHLVAVASKDPSMAVCLVHMHDCLEATKADVKIAKRDIRIMGTVISVLMLPVAAEAVKALFHP